MDLRTRIRTSLRSTILRAAVVRMRHVGIHQADAFVASYPKSGNTWLRFMLGQLLADAEMSFDSVEAFIPPVGAHRRGPRVLPGGGRLIKTHESYRDPYGTAIYLVRDGRDVSISYYHHQLRQGTFDGEFSSFLARFLDGRADAFGVWHEHVASWLDSPIARRGRLEVVRYEEMRRDALGTMKRVLGLLGVATSDERIRAIIEANTMERMRRKEETASVVKKKRSDIPIVRKGAPGEWRQVFTERDHEMFLERAGTMLARLGYETGPNDTAVRRP
jgi:hypothetical protein